MRGRGEGGRALQVWAQRGCLFAESSRDRNCHREGGGAELGFAPPPRRKSCRAEKPAPRDGPEGRRVGMALAEMLQPFLREAPRFSQGLNMAMVMA